MSNFQDIKKTGHAYLLIHQESSVRIEKAKELGEFLLENVKVPYESHPDFFVYHPTTIKYGIDLVKKITTNLALKPYHLKRKIVILHDVQELKQEAQNALLKTLEEPSESSIIILTANHHQNILATIASRCEIYYLQNIKSQSNLEKNETIQTYTQMLKASLPEKFQWVEILSKSEDTLTLLKSWLRYTRGQLRQFVEENKIHSPQTKKAFYNITLLKQTIVTLEKTNTNVKLALEVLLLKLLPFD